MGGDTIGTDEGYVDLYLLPVGADSLDAYRQQATLFGQVVKEHGGLGYREFVADDPGQGFAVREGAVLTAAVAEFSSREHRDEVMEKVLKDPRVSQMMEGDQIGDMADMRYGGFRTFVAP
jgi:uncharacterized protein YbaA (DUF1428 family)